MVCSLMENKIYSRGYYVYHCYLMKFDKKVFGPNTCVTAGDFVTDRSFAAVGSEASILSAVVSLCNRYLVNLVFYREP